MLWKIPLRYFSPGRDKARLLVFIFHRVLERPDPILPGEPDRAQFRWMVRFIRRNFSLLTFGRAVELLNRGELPPAAACITFDDGYRDNHDLALPILREEGACATFFVATGFLNGGRMWNDDVIEAIRVKPQLLDWSDLGLGRHELGDIEQRPQLINKTLGALKYRPHAERARVAREIARRAGVADDSTLMMDDAEVRALRAAGMEVGAHTDTHPILASVDDATAMAEIVKGKGRLEEILGERVDVFAYPNGNPERDFQPRHVDMVRAAGFLAAATTAWGTGRVSSDTLQVPRFTPWDRTPFRFAARSALMVARRDR